MTVFGLKRTLRAPRSFAAGEPNGAVTCVCGRYKYPECDELAMVSTDIEDIRPEAQDEVIVDVDFHLNVSVEELLPYVENDRMRMMLERTGHPPGMQHWSGEYATNQGAGGLAAQGEAHDGEDIAEAINEVSVDIPIVTTGLNYVPTAHNPRMKTSICRAYNDYIVDNLIDAHEDIKAQLMMPQWNPDAMLEELDRHGDETDIVGAYGWFGPYSLLGNPEYDPVFEKLVDLGMPYAIHGSGGYWPHYDKIGEDIRTWTELLGLGWPVHAMMYVGNLIMTGTFDKYPDLNILVQEGGVNWIPFAANRLDEFYRDHPEDISLTERMYDAGQIYLDELPSEYLYENFYFATQPLAKPDRRKHHQALLEMCRAEQTLCFSSDWPHHTFDVPNWVFESAISDEMRADILRGNAAELFDLDL